MRPEREVPDVQQTWLRHAETDLELARTPLPTTGLYEHLCFHAQQAAEKSLKAVLIQLGIEPPHTHSIQRLIELLPDEIDRPDCLIAATRLTAYAVTTRYPGEEEPVSKEEHEQAVSTAESVY